MSRKRIADRQSDRGRGEIELVLTPDTYSLLVLSQGYEPTELTPVQLALGDTLTLEPARLRAGNARILGFVVGVQSDQALRVELLGDGRRPCGNCATQPDPGSASPPGSGWEWTRKKHCPVCGYAEKSTHAWVANSGKFTLDLLVSGTYAIRLMEEGGRTIGLPRFVELHAEESLPVEMESGCLRSVYVELSDTDGRSLAKEWAERLRRRIPAEEARVAETDSGKPPVPHIRFECTFRVEDVRLASSVLIPPAKELGARRPSPFSGRKLGAGPRKPRLIDDRLRGKSEHLEPEARTLRVEPSTLVSAVDGEGLALFELAPSLALTLEMESGPFTATVTIPASWETTRVHARLTREAPSPASAETATTFLEFEANRSR